MSKATDPLGSVSPGGEAPTVLGNLKAMGLASLCALAVFALLYLAVFLPALLVP